MPIKFIPHRRAIPAPAPPFASNSAVNGLSVDPVTGAIVFGQDVGAVGDPAQLLSDREIPLNGFGFTFGIPGDRRLVVDPVQDIYVLGNFDGATGGQVLIDGTSFSSSLSALDGATTSAQYVGNADSGGGIVDSSLIVDDGVNRMQLAVDLANNSAFLAMNALNYLLFDFTAMLYQFGDVDGANLGTRFGIDDATGNFNFENAAMNAVINMNGVPGFTGTVVAPATITVNGGIVTNVA